jgi:hypothetical protein
MTRHWRLPATLAAFLLFGCWASAAYAGTLAQLQMQSRAVKSAPRMDLCLGGARTANCRAAIDTALHAAVQSVALKGRPLAEHELSSAAQPAPAFASPQAQPLKFNTDPEWKKRAIVIAHEGLTFMRLPQGASHELVVGINRHGILGFSLKDTTGE